MIIFLNILKNYKNLSAKIKTIIKLTNTIISIIKIVLLTPSFKNDLNTF